MVRTCEEVIDYWTFSRMTTFIRALSRYKSIFLLVVIFGVWRLVLECTGTKQIFVQRVFSFARGFKATCCIHSVYCPLFLWGSGSKQGWFSLCNMHGRGMWESYASDKSVSRVSFGNGYVKFDWQYEVNS